MDGDGVAGEQRERVGAQHHLTLLAVSHCCLFSFLSSPPAVYGHLSAEEKEKHAAELREQLVGKLKVQFQAIELWDTNGEVQDWKLVQRFPLKQ